MILDIDTYGSVGKLAAEVEALTGKGIEFLIQPLHESQLGVQKTARGDVVHHLVIINESYKDIRHAIACYQMRLILGRCNIKSPEKDLTTQDSAVRDIFIVAQAKIGVDAARQLADRIAAGAVIQLMSVTPGLRAHLEIMKLQPELVLQHRRAMTILAQNNLKNLNPPSMPIPAKFIKWNKALIALENVGLARLTEDQSLIGPLKLLGLYEEAERLVLPLLSGVYDDLDNREIIDLTARHIGMSNIHLWVKA